MLNRNIARETNYTKASLTGNISLFSRWKNCLELYKLGQILCFLRHTIILYYARARVRKNNMNDASDFIKILL